MSDFENDIKEMFEGAEFQPSDKLWSGIEKGLVGTKKKGLFLLWQTYGVAAGIALVLSLGILWQSGYFQSEPDPLTKSELSEKEDLKLDKDSIGLDQRDQDKLVASIDSTENGINNSYLASTKAFGDSSNKEAVPLQILARVNDQSADKSKNEIKTGIIKPESRRTIVYAVPKAFVESSAARTARWINGLRFSTMDLMTKNGFSTKGENYIGEQFLNGRVGNNNLNIGPPVGGVNAESALDANLAASSVIFNEEETALGALSVGFGFSFELSKRLMLNTSIRYSEFRNSSSSNAYSVENGRSLPIYLPAGYDSDNVNFVGPYNLTNSLQGVSFLSSLSYELLQFGKFNVAFLGGFGLDHFFSYKIKGDLNFLEVRKADLSHSNFIQEFNLSTLTGLSLNYRLNEQLGLSSDVTYRYFIPTNAGEGRRTSSILGFGLSLNYFIRKRD